MYGASDMIELYYKIKVICFFIGLGILALLILSFIGMIIYEELKWSAKINYLSAIGFERYLHNVASVGNRAWYGWKRKTTNEYILESSIKHMSLRQIKDKYKEERNNNEE